MTARIVLEVPGSWFEQPQDGHRHRRLYTSLLSALAQLGETVSLQWLPFGADAAPRIAAPGQLIISYHSHGTQPGVLRIKEAYVPPLYTFDPTGYSGFSSLARDPEAVLRRVGQTDLIRAREIVARTRRQFLDTGLSKYPQTTGTDRALPDDHLFYPLQTAGDPVARFRAFDQIEALRALIRFGEVRNRPVVVKRHPLCRNTRIAQTLERLQAQHPDLIVSEASVHNMIAGAACVFGGNSGALFEALVHGKPVVCFGRSDFSCVTRTIDRLEQIPEALDTPVGIDPDLRDRFLGWYLSEYCIHADDVPAMRRRIAEALAARNDAAGRRSPQLLYGLRLRAWSMAERARRGVKRLRG